MLGEAMYAAGRGPSMNRGEGDKCPLWISVPHYTVEGQRTTILLIGAIEPNLSF